MDICKFSGSPVFAPGTSDLLVGAAVYVFNSGTTTPATVYRDPNGDALHTFPIIVGSDGLIPGIWWGEGTFRVRVEVSASDNTPVWDFDGIRGEVIPTGGGGGGTPPDAELFKTGALRFEFFDGSITGYVRANGRSIGSASSGATERANADTQALFLKCWDAMPDSVCPVSGGRGANAASDWAANKALTLPNARGAAIVGLDTMGNTAGNIIQRSTSLTTVQASNIATVLSPVGIVRGMYINATTVPAGTTVTAVSGTTITMSQAATITFTGEACRFSVLRDAQVPGATGGLAYTNQVGAEVGLHNHPTSVGGSPIMISAGIFDLDLGSGTPDIGVETNTLTIGENTGGQPMNNVQPSIGVTVFIKL